MDELRKKEGSFVADGKIILAHLGNGASLAAVKNGSCVETSMGFTPTGGFMMGTRCGDLDPGVAWYLMQNKGMSADQFNHLINHESGLLGVSGLSADMQELLEQEHLNPRAAFAIALFCYQISKWIGAFTVVLGGLDTLVFSGGIGEHAPEIRGRIGKAIHCLGLEIEEELNRTNQYLITGPRSKVKVLVIPTDEEIMMAKMVLEKYAASQKQSLI
jgi:acetate kinase